MRVIKTAQIKARPPKIKQFPTRQRRTNLPTTTSQVAFNKTQRIKLTLLLINRKTVRNPIKPI